MHETVFRTILKHWKIYVLIIIIAIFLNASGCMCGEDDDNAGDGDESAEDQFSNIQDMFDQMNQGMCENGILAQLGLCGGTGLPTPDTGTTTTTIPADICDRCPAGAAGDICRTVCQGLSEPQLSGTKIVKDSEYSYSYSFSMNVKKDTIYNMYFKALSGATHQISDCASTASANTAARCSGSAVVLDLDYSQVCVDYWQEGGALKTKCENFATSTAPIIDLTPPTNLPPGVSVSGQEYYVNQGARFEYVVKYSDPDCDDDLGCVTFSYTSTPTLTETFTLNPHTGRIIFTPGQDDVGTFNIEITVNDGEFSDKAIMIIHVIDTNDNPVVSIPDISLPEDEEYQIDLAEYAEDADESDSITWSAASTSTSSKLTITISGDTATIKSAANWHGNEMVKFTATDNKGGSGSDTIKVTVTSESDSPWVQPVIPSRTLNEDFGLLSIDLTAYEKDDDDTGTGLTWTVSESDSSKIEAGISNSDDDILSLRSVANANGETTVKLTLTDSEGNSIDTDMTITINPINDRPILSVLPDIVISEGSPYMLDLTNYGTDPDEDEELVWIYKFDYPEVEVTYNSATNSMLFTVEPGTQPTVKYIQLIVTDYSLTATRWIKVVIEASTTTTTLS
ncbi:MAG: Ig-like domain-containing protein [Candidatus Woesearchaeota archaeon]